MLSGEEKCPCGRAEPLEPSPFTGQLRCSPCLAAEKTENFYSDSPWYKSMSPAMECPECGMWARPQKDDYICWRCRRLAGNVWPYKTYETKTRS